MNAAANSTINKSQISQEDATIATQKMILKDDGVLTTIIPLVANEN